MARVDHRLELPLRKIAALAVTSASEAPCEPEYDLFAMRNVISQSRQQVVAFVRAEVERLSRGARTVRTVRAQSLRHPAGHTAIHCVVCPASTPEGMVQAPEPGMFVFVVAGGDPGYFPAT